MSLDPWAPPKSDLAPEPLPGVGLTRALLEGAAAMLVALAGVSLLVGVAFALGVPLVRHASIREAMFYAHHLPYVDHAAAVARLVVVAVGGAVAARRYRGPWPVGAAML